MAASPLNEAFKALEAAVADAQQALREADERGDLAEGIAAAAQLDHVQRQAQRLDPDRTKRQGAEAFEQLFSTSTEDHA